MHFELFKYFLIIKNRFLYQLNILCRSNIYNYIFIIFIINILLYFNKFFIIYYITSHVINWKLIIILWN